MAIVSEKTLIVIDNVDNSAQSQLVFKFINDLRNLKIPFVSISILITSFDDITPQKLSGELFKLNSMSLEDATKLVRQNLGVKTSENDDTQLLCEFQNFPLHLQHAVHYIKSKSYELCGGFNVSDYL